MDRGFVSPNSTHTQGVAIWAHCTSHGLEEAVDVWQTPHRRAPEPPYECQVQQRTGIFPLSAWKGLYNYRNEPNPNSCRVDGPVAAREKLDRLAAIVDVIRVKLFAPQHSRQGLALY